MKADEVSCKTLSNQCGAIVVQESRSNGMFVRKYVNKRYFLDRQGVFMRHSSTGCGFKEYELLRKAESPAVIEVAEFWDDLSVSFFTMPYALKLDVVLENHAPKHKWEWLRISAAMAKGIEAFHNQRLVHRDVKLENFVVSVPHDNNFGVVKLIDGGASREVSSTGRSMTLNVWTYSPPECRRAGLDTLRPSACFPFDIWQLCLALACLATEQQEGPPFQFDFEEFGGRRYLHRIPDVSGLVQDVSTATERFSHGPWKTMIARGLDEDPTKRPEISAIIEMHKTSLGQRFP